MNTVRELIILDLLSRAAVVRTAGSPQPYATNCGETVFRARLKVDPDDLPCIVVHPKNEEAENMHGQSRRRMNLQVDGVAKFGTSDPSVIGERILGDLVKCFTSPSWARSPDYIESIVYIGGGYETPEDGSLSVGAQATFILTYWTAIGDPYSQ